MWLQSCDLKPLIRTEQEAEMAHVGRFWKHAWLTNKHYRKKMKCSREDPVCHACNHVMTFTVRQHQDRSRLHIVCAICSFLGQAAEHKAQVSPQIIVLWCQKHYHSTAQQLRHLCALRQRLTIQLELVLQDDYSKVSLQLFTKQTLCAILKKNTPRNCGNALIMCLGVHFSLLHASPLCHHDLQSVSLGKPQM